MFSTPDFRSEARRGDKPSCEDARELTPCTERVSDLSKICPFLLLSNRN